MNAEKAKQTILDAIEAIDMALVEEPLPETGPMSRKQLVKFRDHLYKMLGGVESGSFVDIPLMGRIIVDSWQFNSRLGDLILRAEQAYQKLKAQK